MLFLWLVKCCIKNEKTTNKQTKNILKSLFTNTACDQKEKKSEMLSEIFWI